MDDPVPVSDGISHAASRIVPAAIESAPLNVDLCAAARENDAMVAP